MCVNNTQIRSINSTMYYGELKIKSHHQSYHKQNLTLLVVVKSQGDKTRLEKNYLQDP